MSDTTLTAFQVYTQARELLLPKETPCLTSKGSDRLDFVSAILFCPHLIDSESESLKTAAGDIVSALREQFPNFTVRVELEVPETGTISLEIRRRSSIPDVREQQFPSLEIGSKVTIRGVSWQGWEAEILEFLPNNRAKVFAVKGNSTYTGNIRLSSIDQLLES